MADLKTKSNESAPVTESANMLGQSVASTAQGTVQGIASGVGSLSDMYQKLRKDASGALSAFQAPPSLSETQKQILTDVNTGKIPSAGIHRGAFNVESAKDASVPYRLSGTQVKGGKQTPYRMGGEESSISDYEVITDQGVQSIRDISDIVPGKGVLFMVDAGGNDTREVFVPMERLKGSLRDASEEIDKQRREAQAEERRRLAAPFFQYSLDQRYQFDNRGEGTAIVDPPDEEDSGDEDENDDEDLKTTIGDALGYASDKGPYAGQDLSDEDVYAASAIDFDNANNEVERREVNGVEVIEFENESVFIDTGDGVINVTGHPDYDPNVGGN